MRTTDIASNRGVIGSYMILGRGSGANPPYLSFGDIKAHIDLIFYRYDKGGPYLPFIHFCPGPSMICLCTAILGAISAGDSGAWAG